MNILYIVQTNVSPSSLFMLLIRELPSYRLHANIRVQYFVGYLSHLQTEVK